ncbi:MAG: glycoside hydrolase family 9 protein [bacterium]
MKKLFLFTSIAFFLISISAAQERSAIPDFPMPLDQEVYERSLDKKWLEKPLIETVLLDNMEDLSTWRHKGVGESSLTTERAVDGSHSIRLISPTVADVKGPTLSIGMSSQPVIGFPYGTAGVERIVDNEDWSDYNRISFWAYPDLPGFRTIVMTVILNNDGVQKVPGPYGGRNGRHFIFLEANKWNHCVWEIPHLARDKVTGIELEYRLQGNEPGAAEMVTYYFDKLELQKVDADYFEGWQVAPGHIAYSHTGYQPEKTKTALASDLQAMTFSVIDRKTGKVVLDKAIREDDYSIGRFQVMDFSEVNKPGTYILKAGDRETQAFNIGDDIWRETIIKTVNFFYSERCGTHVEGIHDYCHGDWICQHIPTGQRYMRAYKQDRQIIVNGGWHDAGNLAQGTAYNTAKAAYAMLKLSESLLTDDPELSDLLLEEATWGMDWVLKTRFGDGYRVRWAPMDAWTDNIIGTYDDIKFTAKNEPMDNFVGSFAEAQFSKMIKNEKPLRSDYSLKCAEEDWLFGVEEMENRDYRNGDYLDEVSAGILSAVELYKITGKQEYIEKAIEYADYVSQCQETEVPSWDIPLTGFFYINENHDQIYRHTHASDEYLLTPGLIQLCQMFPDHADWMKWYRTIALYSDYYKNITEFVKPYDMIPASIYESGEGDRPYNLDQHSFSLESFENQVRNGIKLSDDYYLRRFSVWFTKRGNTSTTLGQASALSPAAIYRNDDRLEEICRKQLEWNLGRNPFAQSLMYGEGYNYSSQYSSMGGNMIGALPVGSQTDYNKDIPYWPSDVCFNYKELWVHPSSLWLLMMDDQYKIKEKMNNPAKIDFQLSADQKSKKKTVISCRINGDNNTSFELRGWNIKADKPVINNKGGEKTIQWTVSVIDPSRPCVAAVIPDNDHSALKDVVFNTGK